MALLPAENLLDGTKTPTTTTAEMRGALGTQRRFLADLFGTDSTDKAAARGALGAAPVVSAVLTKNVAGNADIALLPIEALNDMLIFTGALTGNIAVVVPNTAKVWKVWNKTTGAFALTLKTAAGAGVAIAQGKKRDLWCDGSDVLAGLTDFSDNPIPAIPMPITVRQAIQYGPTTGIPTVSNLVPQSQIGGLNTAGVTLKHSVAATLYSAANGFNADGSPNNINRIATADINSGALFNGATNYIFYDTATGTVSVSVYPDLEQYGPPTVAPVGQFIFDMTNFKGYVGTGVGVSPSTRVPAIEVDTDGTKIIAIRNRAFLGVYYPDFAQTLSNSLLIKNHNIGTNNVSAVFLARCNAASEGYQPGQVFSPAVSATNYFYPPQLPVGKNTVQVACDATTGSWCGTNQSTRAASVITQANFSCGFLVKRNY